MKKTIKTYCYGELKEFKTFQAAQNFYFEAMNSCEGSERDRYTDIYCKLMSGVEPYCDCDGVAKKVDKIAPLTDDEIIEAKHTVIKKKLAGNKLDTLLEEYAKREIEFRKENEKLLKDIETARDEWSELWMKVLSYEKRGFKA